MTDSINCGILIEKGFESPKPDKAVDKPFYIQADDIHGMFRCIVRSVPSKNDKGDQ